MCCIENVLNAWHIKSVDLWFAVSAHLGTMHKQNFSFWLLCMRVRRTVSLMHLRFAYFKAIIVSYWTFSSLVSFSFFSHSLYSLLCARILFISVASECSFFLSETKKSKNDKDKHKLSEQQHTLAHTRIFACASVSLCCAPFQSRCASVCFFSHSVHFYNLFLFSFFLSI